MGWERTAQIRKDFWSRYGTVSDLAWFGPTNGMMSAWPGHAENHVPIRAPGMGIITTDGLSAPYEEDDLGDELELYIESPELDAPMEELIGHWLNRALMFTANSYGGQRYRPTFDFYHHTTMRLRDTGAPADWLNEDGLLGILTGVPARGRPAYIQVDDDPEAILLVPLTPLRPAELAWVLETGDREGMAEKLAASEWGHVADPDRPSLI